MTTTEYSVTSNSVTETHHLGTRIGELLQPGACLGLTGDLGAGKTHLVKGIAAGLGVGDPSTVNSPTFVIVNEYDGRLHVYHVDVYRLHAAEELSAIGFDEMIQAGGVVLVEWADRIDSIMPSDRAIIHLEHLAPTVRRIRIQSHGKQSQSWVAALADS